MTHDYHRTKVVRKLRELFCRHDWRPSKFQALNGGRSYQCMKCGKYRHEY